MKLSVILEALKSWSEPALDSELYRDVIGLVIGNFFKKKYGVVVNGPSPKRKYFCFKAGYEGEVEKFCKNGFVVEVYNEFVFVKHILGGGDCWISKQ